MQYTMNVAWDQIDSDGKNSSGFWMANNGGIHIEQITPQILQTACYAWEF